VKSEKGQLEKGKRNQGKGRYGGERGHEKKDSRGGGVLGRLMKESTYRKREGKGNKSLFRSESSETGKEGESTEGAKRGKGESSALMLQGEVDNKKRKIAYGGEKQGGREKR